MRTFKQLTALLAITLCATVAAPLSMAEDVSKPYAVENMDTFMYDHSEDAISCADSQVFDVQFYIVESSYPDETSPNKVRMQFVLDLTPKVDKTIYSTHIDVHYSELLQAMLVSGEWYNEYTTLYPANSGKIPTAIEYTKDTLIDLRPISAVGGITMDDMYKVYVEVSWREGLFDKHSEIWDMSQTGYQAAVDWYNALPDDAPERQNKLIDEDSLAAINEKAKALSN